MQKGIEAGQTVEDIIKNLDMPWYKEWTGVTPSGDNVKQVYGELTGRVAPADLLEDLGVAEGPSPTKDTPGWKPPTSTNSRSSTAYRAGSPPWAKACRPGNLSPTSPICCKNAARNCSNRCACRCRKTAGYLFPGDR